MHHNVFKKFFNRLITLNQSINSINKKDDKITVERYDFFSDDRIMVALHVPGKNIFPSYEIRKIVNDKIFLKQIRDNDRKQLLDICKLNQIKTSSALCCLKSISFVNNKKMVRLETSEKNSVISEEEFEIKEIMENEKIIRHLSDKEVKLLQAISQ